MNNENHFEDNLFGAEVRRKLKLQAHVTSKLGKHKDKEKRLNLFWNKIWPALEELGWTKIEGTGRMSGAITFVLPGKNGAESTLFKGRDCFDSIRDVLNRLLEGRTPEEADIANMYVALVGESNHFRRLHHQHHNEDGGEFGKPGRGRRRIGLGRPARGTNRLLDTSWKESRHFPKQQSRVGDEYQVLIFPSASEHKEEDNDSDKLCEKVWDPTLAQEKGIDFEKDDVVAKVHHSKKEEALIKLHEAGYDLGNFDEMVMLISAVDGSDWPDEKKKQYHQEIFKVRKDLEAVSKSLEIPMKSTLAYYYGTFKTSDDYRLLKTVCVDERLSEEGESLEFGLDACAICGDGGSLVICDGCEGEYHLNCLNPPLRNVPEGHWECDDCVDKKLLAARNYLISKTKLFVLDESKKRELEETKGEKSDDQGEGSDSDLEMYEPVEPLLEAVKRFCSGISNVTTGKQLKVEE